MKNDVKESSQYDNFIGQKVEVQKNSSLVDFFDGELEDDDSALWKKHWKGMPEFVQEAQKPYKSILMHFRTEEDLNKFIELVDPDMTEKTKSAWFPKKQVTKNFLLRWVEEGDEE